MSAKYIVGVECVMMIMLLVGSLDLARLASSRHQEQYTDMNLQTKISEAILHEKRALPTLSDMSY